jgi:septal ring factor EnvC (AmiA/AmiB activator)
MITITTKEAERFARWCDTDGFTERATALRSLAAERDALRAERDDLAKRLKDAERERNHQHGRADRNAKLHAMEQKKREQLQAENARLRAAIEMARECIDDKDVIGARQTLTMALGETQ